MLIGGTLFNLLLLRQCLPASIFIWSPLVYLMIWKMKQRKRSECRIRRGPGSFELIVQRKELSGKKKQPKRLRKNGRQAWWDSMRGTHQEQICEKLMKFRLDYKKLMDQNSRSGSDRHPSSAWFKWVSPNITIGGRLKRKPHKRPEFHFILVK